LIFVAIALTSEGRCLAARLVRISISVDGKVVMTSGWGDDGHPGADAVWRYLRQAKFTPPRNSQIEPDPSDASTATLKGRVVLDVAYGGRADVSELKLVRAADGSWQVAPEEIERTFKLRHKPFAFRISIGGTPMYWTVQQTRSGKDADSPENVWRELKRLTIYGKKIAPDADGPLHATLTGGVKIELVYAEQTWGRADTPELKLVRNRPDILWRIAPAEVERTLASHTKTE
jgi:hypothetical protein